MPFSACWRPSPGTGSASCSPWPPAPARPPSLSRSPGSSSRPAGTSREPSAARASSSWPTATSWRTRLITLLGLHRGCPHPHRPGFDPPGGQGSHQRQHLLHHLPDLHDRPDAEGKRAPYSAITRLTSLTWSSSTSAIAAARTTKALGAAFWNISTGRPARPDGHPQAQGQRGYLRLFRRAGIHLLAQRGHQRRISDTLQGGADPRRWTNTSMRPTIRWSRVKWRGPALHRRGLQPHHRNQGARREARRDSDEQNRPARERHWCFAQLRPTPPPSATSSTRRRQIRTHYTVAA